MPGNLRTPSGRAGGFRPDELHLGLSGSGRAFRGQLHLRCRLRWPDSYDATTFRAGFWVPAFCTAVKAPWDDRDKTIFNTQLRTAILLKAQQITHPPGYLRSISRAGSGQTQDGEGHR